MSLYGAQQYSDVLELLTSKGLTATFTQTGGMHAAIAVTLEAGQVLLITDAEDSLCWERENHAGWGVGLYARGSEFDEGPLAFESDSDGAPERLVPLITRVLRAPSQS